IGSGPFRFVEFKPNERITLTRNPDYWKSGRPYLDGIEFTIIRDMSTANLAFIAGKTDWIATTIPLMKDITSRGARSDLRSDTGRHQPQPTDQPRQAAIQRPRDAAGDGA